MIFIVPYTLQSDILEKLFSAGTQRLDNVASTTIQRHALTFRECEYKAMHQSRISVDATLYKRHVPAGLEPK